MFQDRKEIELAGRKYIIRQRSLQDIISLERLYDKYGNNQTGHAILMAAVIRDAMKHDNWRIGLPVIKRLFPITIKWVMRNFSIKQMQHCQKLLMDLETYQVKKKETEAEQAG